MDDEPKMKLVVTNSLSDAHDALKQRLSADLNRAFGIMAANLLLFLRGSGEVALDPVLMDNLVQARKAYAAEIEVGNLGVPIKSVDFSKQPKGHPDPDEAVNTMIRGALGMVAALVLKPGEKGPGYEEARDELAQGLIKANRKIEAERAKSRSRRT